MNKSVACLVLIVGLMVQQTFADFWYNHVYPKTLDEAKKLKLKCIPGRTVIRVEENKKPEHHDTHHDEDEEEDPYGLRTHAHYVHKTKDESCKMCICNVAGNDEICLSRPAVNVNECIRISQFVAEMERGVPFDHVRDLYQVIRRGGNWTAYSNRQDDIPPLPGAKCESKGSYYTNHPDPTHAADESVEDQLSYGSENICFFCVCSVDGMDVGCIPRDDYFCEYIKVLTRDENVIRDMYTSYFRGVDFPKYKRQIYWNIRRSIMDDGLFELIDLAGSKDCIPYVSEYTDCSPENQCTGCTRCTCSATARWVCQKVIECPRKWSPMLSDGVNKAFDTLLYEVKNKQNDIIDNKLPDPVTAKDQLLDQQIDLEKKIAELMTRRKREAAPKDKAKTKSKSKDKIKQKVKSNTTNDGYNGTVKFYHTVDELNEDTLKNSNASGTIQARKFDMDYMLSRRADPVQKDNFTLDNPLHIESSEIHHTNNKIDVNRTYPHLDIIKTNHTQQEKDKELSKIVVNELKKGIEVIGDKNGPIRSNITFTPENDTLTAMAFIAGNLLNKLWSMEKDGSDESVEVETMKTEKINDLLELFKEPLTMRQELFLKNALESLSHALEKNKDLENVSLCQSIEDAKKFLKDVETAPWEKSDIPIENCKLEKANRKNNIDNLKADDPRLKQKNATVKAMSKLNSVLSLVKKYENLTKHLNNLKNKPIIKKNSASKNVGIGLDEDFTSNESDSLNMFGRILAKITKLLLPYKGNKKIVKTMKNINILNNKDNKIKEKYNRVFNVDLTNDTISAKDRMILDYLSRINSYPRPLFEDNLSNEGPTGFVEGDILLNLSEFFKIKSYAELIKNLDLNKKATPKVKKNKSDMTEVTEDIKKALRINLHENQPDTTIRSEPEIVLANNDYPTVSTTSDMQISTTETSPKLISVKNKLKEHLKTILNDLMELQKESGIPGKKGQVQIAEALPCIYNILTADNEITAYQTPPEKFIDPYEKITDIFVQMREELSNINNTADTRRFDDQESLDMMKNPPHSSLVWERVVRNLNENDKRTFRRNNDIKPPLPYEDLKKSIQKLEETSPKIHLDKVSNVMPGDQLMFLKTLNSNVQRILLILKDVKASFDIIESLPEDKKQDIEAFVISSESKLEVNQKALNNFEAIKHTKKDIDNIESHHNVKPMVEPVIQNELNPKSDNHHKKDHQGATRFSIKKNEERKEQKRQNTKIHLTRDEVLNQLIRNRVTLVLQKKQQQENYETDPDYGIAKNILISLDKGSYKLARKLYKILINNKEDSQVNSVGAAYKRTTVIPPPTLAMADLMLTAPDELSTDFLLQKEPIIHFQDPWPITNQIMAAKRDQVLKKLLNSNNFRVM